ncbi:MAG: hypothetical protein AB7U95_37110 [Reyranella sp.]
MEARVAVLENEVKHIREDIGLLRAATTNAAEDISTIKVDVATLKERILHLPTKSWAVGIAVTTVTVVGGLISIAPKLQALWSVAPLVKP